MSAGAAYQAFASRLSGGFPVVVVAAGLVLMLAGATIGFPRTESARRRTNRVVMLNRVAGSVVMLLGVAVIVFGYVDRARLSSIG